MNIYDFKVQDQASYNISLSEYKGKVLLIVNTATECGFTPQYNALETFYEKHQSQGFEILDFPCNQFLNQAPGTDEELHAVCVRRFAIKFKQFKKIDVNGDNAIALYKYLRENTTFNGFDEKHQITPILKDVLSKIDSNYAQNSDIKWNFTKFLIDREGNIVQRFEPTFNLDEMFAAIENQINK